MNYIISVYTENAFQEYILPSVNNTDHYITLRSSYYGICNDVRLELEIINGVWFIKKNALYTIDITETQNNRYRLENGLKLSLTTSDMDEIILFVDESDSVFHAFDKFDISSAGEITIGKNKDNSIVYDNKGMVSHNHAVIRKDNGSYVINNKSPNGVYINNIHIHESYRLSFGDYINILGLHLVFLGDVIAIDLYKGDVEIDRRVLISYVDKTGSLDDAKDNDGALYHRSPRNYEKLSNDKIEIEAPPKSNVHKRQSLFMTIGPAITMAFPMMAGCLLMMYSSSKAGGSRSLYMYSGLVMAVSSAIVTTVWTLINRRNQKKEEEIEENIRINEYSRYLSGKEEEIRDIYDDSERRLVETYPAAEYCLNFDVSDGRIWGRNNLHEDFLAHRLGLGDKEFQYDIETPKKEFTLSKDRLADGPFDIKAEYVMLHNVPITVDLYSHKLIGLVSKDDVDRAVETAKVLISQIAANNCYTDVKMAFLYDGNAKDDGRWGSVKWLPHVWSEDHRVRYIGSTESEVSDIIYELSNVFRNREELEDSRINVKNIKPYYVLFVSDPMIIENTPMSKYAFEEKECYGLTTIILSDSIKKLPNECEFVIENSSDFSGMYHIYEARADRQVIQFDKVSEESLDSFARMISSLKVPENEEGGELPASITFFDMYNISRIEDYPVIDNWIKTRTYENIRGMLGVRSGNQPCYLDVHEKFHGPHGLIAGTTGSGKSETLQTYILSLAINYSPDDVTFFIIDYKGGGMAHLFDGLPHMIGQISNLSGNQVNRAMISIKSENRRRQRVFTENGVNNINAYTKLYKSGEVKTPIPHLFIIIDEFAELKNEEPEFMKELISVAQVGRSLGVHLILATQKPSGNVDNNIWSNSKFRICLRVQDQQDSKDMLHKPDAAFIVQAGRGYLQVGNDEVYELFQSGFSGALYDSNAVAVNKDIAKILSLPGRVEMTGNSVRLSQKKKSEEIWVKTLVSCVEDAIAISKHMVDKTDNYDRVNKLIDTIYTRLNGADVDYPVNSYNTDRLKEFVLMYEKVKKVSGDNNLVDNIIDYANASGKKLPSVKESTELEVTKNYLNKLAKAHGYNHIFRLWMPVLGSHILLSEFDEFNTSKYDGCWKQQGKGLSVIVGKMDDPANQAQLPVVLNLSECGHAAVCGSVTSGKSTFLQTVIYGLINRYSPNEVNIYALDFSSKMLLPFMNAPHVGGVVCDDNLELTGKLFNMLKTIVSERKALFSGSNYSQYIMVHKDTVLPTIVIVIDNYAAFSEKTRDEYLGDLTALSKEGIALGIHLILSDISFGINGIPNRIAENIGCTYALALKDKYAYGDVFHVSHVDIEPERGIKGRGLTVYDARILEFQVALAVDADNDYIRNNIIEELCIDMSKNWNGALARRIPVIPDNPVLSEYIRLSDYRYIINGKKALPIGYDRESAGIYAIPLKDIYCYLITGGVRTGKTNLIRVLISSSIGIGSRVVVIDSDSRPLRMYSKEYGVTYLHGEDEIYSFFSNSLTPEFQRRNRIKNRLLNEDKEDTEIYEFMSHEQPWMIFVADMVDFVNMIYTSSKNMSGFMENIIAKGRMHNIYFFGEVDNKSIPKVKGQKVFDIYSGYSAGINVGGKVYDNTVLPFDYIKYNDRSSTIPVGVGVISGDENYKDTKAVVIPLASK